MSSLSCWLSMLSPVDTAQSNGRPVTGPRATALTRSTMADATWVDMASWGRWALAKGPGKRSVNSTRAGLWASMTWTSVRCTMDARAVRRPSRPGAAAASSSRTTSGYGGPSTSFT